MFDRYFELFYNVIGRKKWPVFIAVMALIGAALVGLRFINFSNNIEALLPADPDISRSMAFLKDSNLSNKVVISLALTAPDKDKKDLFAAVDQLAGSLKPPLFTKVTVGLSELKMTDDMEFFFDKIPQIFTDDDLTAIGGQINQKGISERMRKNYFQLLKPEGIFMNSMLRSDPLGFNIVMLNKLKALSTSLGYNVTVEGGHFISPDNRHAMIIAQTTVPVTDARGSKQLFADIDEQLRKLPNYISADIVSGHSHTLSNEKVIKKDVALTSIVASVVFVLLFLFIFKDASAVLIFLIPLFSIFQAIYICYFFMGGLSYSVIGLATVLAGISVDYGIQVYVAARNAKDTAHDISRIARPVAVGALTTVAVFFSFLFSRIEGYQQLGYLSILGLALSLVYCFLILPHFVSKKTMGLKVGWKLEEVNWSNNAVVGIWLGLTLVFLFFAVHVKFDSNIYKIDGTESSILRAEKRFQEIWGQERPAMLVTAGKSLEEALERNDRIAHEAIKAIGADHFSSLSMLWPSEKTRRGNLERWKQFWGQGRESELKRLIGKEGEKYGFATDAFSPFFSNLHRGTITDTGPIDNDLISKLKERFINKTRDGYQVLSFFPDDKKYVDAISELSKKHPETFLVSGRSMSQRISEVIYSDIILMTAITSVLVILLTYFYFRNVKELLMALVPVVTGIVWLFGLMSIFGIAFNLSTLITGIALMGICVDYGIFMVYRCRYNLKSGIVMAVALSAIATLIGTGVLILADHPALFYVGLTMTVGIGAGYLSSLLVIPQLYRLLLPLREEKQ